MLDRTSSLKTKFLNRHLEKHQIFKFKNFVKLIMQCLIKLLNLACKSLGLLCFFNLDTKIFM